MAEKTYDLSLIYQNSTTVHTNKIASQIADSRDFVRSWQSRLAATIENLKGKHTDFLQTSFTDKRTFLENLNSIHFNQHSSWISKALVEIDTSSVLPTLESELGCKLSELRETIEHLMIIYTKCADKLFTVDESLHNKLEKLKTLDTMLSNLVLMETKCVSELQTSISNYVETVYSECEIESDYKEFCKAYSEFLQLRSIVTLLQNAAAAEGVTESPQCPICTTRAVDCALIPCGHSFCKECAAKQQSLCYICRCSIERRLRLYFS